MREELGVDLRGVHAIPLCDYVNPYGRHRYVFYSAWLDLRADYFVLGEGQGFAWYLLEDALALPLTEMTRHDLEGFRAQLQHPTTG